MRNNTKKKINKLINELYDYSKTLNGMPPRGDGAKIEVAKEVHRICLKIFNLLEKRADGIDIQVYHSTLMLLELCEQMLLDKIDEDLDVETIWNIMDMED